MKTIGIMVGVALIVLMLTDAGIGSEWNAGATARAEIAAQAQMHAADRQADAAILTAQEETRRTALWIAVLPLALIIIGATGALWIILYYQAQIRMYAPSARMLFAEPPPPVARLAAQRGSVPQLIDGEWMLIRDGAPVARVRQIAQKG